LQSAADEWESRLRHGKQTEAASTRITSRFVTSIFAIYDEPRTRDIPRPADQDTGRNAPDPPFPLVFYRLHLVDKVQELVAVSGCKGRFALGVKFTTTSSGGSCAASAVGTTSKR
jgi:hypothetical protein